MRVLLVAANTETEPYPVYPLGMSVVARCLADAGHEVLQCDRLSPALPDAALENFIASQAPELVGISLRNVDNVDSLTCEFHWCLDALRDLVAFVRARTAAPVVLGGPGFSLLPEEILDHCGADCGVVGEGERAILRVVRTLEAGEPLPRLVREDGPLPCGDMTAPLLSGPMMRHYLDQGGLPGVQTKRGCGGACAYCSYPLLEGSAIRVRDPREVVEELERLRADHGAKEVFFTDSVFNDGEGRYLDLAEELARCGGTMPFSAYFQPRHTGPDELRLLRRAGLKAMELGTDAASDATLAGLNKGFTVADVLRFQAMCAEQRVPCAHFVIFGGPGETPQTVEESLANLRRLEHCVVFAFTGIRLHTRTALYRRAVREGVVAPDASLLHPVFYHSPGIEPTALVARLEEAFRGRRDRFFPPSRSMEQMAVLRRFGYSGLLWDTLIRFPRSAKEGAEHANALS